MTPVLAIIDDIFFVAKVQETAKQAGVPLKVVGAAGFDAASFAAEPPPLILMDLDCQSADPADLIRRLKSSDQTRNIPLVGFVRHTHTAVQEKAKEAGMDRMLPRSEFFPELPAILREAVGTT